MKIYYFYGQYKASGLGINKTCYIFDLHLVRNVSARFQKKSRTLIYLFKYTNEVSQGKWKILKSEVAENLSKYL